jgi:hypothetical protein
MTRKKWSAVPQDARDVPEGEVTHRVAIVRFVPAVVAAVVACVATSAEAQQVADPNFRATVERRAYRRHPPRVVMDEAHGNFHTADGRYKPLAELLRSDGYHVAGGKEKFTRAALAGVRVLVISNATGPNARADDSEPAFSEDECDAVRDWVRAGGALLLIADHAPFGSAAENLGKRFGVEMGKGYVLDLAHSEPDAPSLLHFTRENGLLGTHAILRGRDARERVNRVVAFTGQSLSGPPGATPLLKLGPTAWEAPNRAETEAAFEKLRQGAPPGGMARPVGGRAQGLAMKFGRGRVVVLGEAALFSAQVVRFTHEGRQQEFPMGMNVPGNDDRQFVLNIFHWLSGALK